MKVYTFSASNFLRDIKVKAIEWKKEKDKKLVLKSSEVKVRFKAAKADEILQYKINHDGDFADVDA